LAEAKAISLVYEYAGCPVLTALARYVLRTLPRTTRLLRFIRSTAYFGEYERGMYLAAIGEMHEHRSSFVKRLHLEPPVGTRFLVERKFGLSVADQLRIEDYLDSLREYGPLDFNAILANCSPVWRSYYDSYVAGISQPCELQYPSLCFVINDGHRREW
jgi:hypothetical protein